MGVFEQEEDMVPVREDGVDLSDDHRESFSQADKSPSVRTGWI